MGSEECIMEGITVNCQVWYSVGPMGSEECITEGITVNCQVWYSVGPMGSEECITEGITVNCQVWYSVGPMGSEECITEGITVNCQVWYSVGPMGSEECITEGITVNCQVWYSVGPMGSEECITEGITVNCQVWYSVGPMGSEECITEGITVNCQVWYSVGPMGSEECITEGITVNCQVWYSVGPMGSEECITEGITVNCQVWYSVGPMGSEECFTEGMKSNLCWHSMSHMGSYGIASRKAAECWYGQSPGWWKRSTVREQSLLAQNESYGLSAVPMEIAAGPDRREVLWVSNICWHSMSDMASAMMGSCWKHQDSREGKHSFHLLNQFSYCKFRWWLILFGSINLGGRGFRGAQRRSCFSSLIPLFLKLIVACRWCVICVKEDDDSKVQAIITRLVIDYIDPALCCPQRPCET